MGSSLSTAPLPPPPMPSINTYPQGTSFFKIPDNSGSIDIDVNNLQRCINAGGGASCIANYVQGYNTKNNQFVPSQITNQGFQLLEGSNVDNSKVVLGIIIAITLLIVLMK
jgi:hypothetical protein